MFERLTKRNGNTVFINSKATGWTRSYCWSEPAERAIQRLADYEDSGLSPEEVQRLAEGKAIYEAYDGSKLDKADQYIEKLEAALDKAIEMLTDEKWQEWRNEGRGCPEPKPDCRTITGECRECWKMYLMGGRKE
jgi:hypothetical protein